MALFISSFTEWSGARSQLKYFCWCVQVCEWRQAERVEHDSDQSVTIVSYIWTQPEYADPFLPLADQERHDFIPCVQSILKKSQTSWDSDLIPQCLSCGLCCLLHLPPLVVGVVHIQEHVPAGDASLQFGADEEGASHLAMKGVWLLGWGGEAMA